MNDKQILKKNLKRAVNNFEDFIYDWFAQGFEGFVGGDHIKKTARFLQGNSRTIRVSAKDHFKSTSLYAYFLWQSLRNPERDLEYHFFSYQQDMAAYHLKKLKLFKLRIPLFEELTDLKELADSVAKYTWDGEHFHTIEPHGLLAFKRGLHGNALVDDPFQDPASKMEPRTIRNINYIMRSQIFDIPHAKDVLHIVGTPQTREDFFFDEKIEDRFAVQFLPAIDREGKALWPEWMSLEELERRKAERGDKIFNQEYLCSPVYVEEAFFTLDQLTAVTPSDYEGGTPEREDDENKYDVVGGFDIGKHRHPSHLSIFEVQEGKWRMLFQKFMDGWDYTAQIEFLQEKIEEFEMDALYYDNSRGEFEQADERGDLPAEMEGVTLSRKMKQALATEFEKAVTQKEITLIDDQRMRNQVLVVTNDLQARETSEGHGDSFWSIALAFKEAAEPRPEFYTPEEKT